MCLVLRMSWQLVLLVWWLLCLAWWLISTIWWLASWPWSNLVWRPTLHYQVGQGCPSRPRRKLDVGSLHRCTDVQFPAVHL